MPGFEYLLAALTPLNIILALGGVIAGTVIGSLPGLTATMAVAVLAYETWHGRPGTLPAFTGEIERSLDASDAPADDHCRPCDWLLPGLQRLVLANPNHGSADQILGLDAQLLGELANRDALGESHRLSGRGLLEGEELGARLLLLALALGAAPTAAPLGLPAGM